jgi:hypothetical protein
MPYQTHPAFIEPKDRNARLWRYMDLARLLSVIDAGALFFPSVAMLSEMDPYEGEPALARIRAAQARGADELRKLRLQRDVFKHLNFFNCWHMNDGESDAMWKLYVKGSEGVAIQSTVGRVISSFASCSDTVYMGAVKYVNHATLAAPTGTPFGFSDYIFKRLAFQHEQEVRLGTYRADVRTEFFDECGLLKTPAPEVRAEDVLLFPGRKGVYVGADVSVLIERVVVSPFSPVWFSDLVVSLSKKLGYTFEVVSSEMSRPSALG